MSLTRLSSVSKKIQECAHVQEVEAATTAPLLLESKPIPKVVVEYMGMVTVVIAILDSGGSAHHENGKNGEDDTHHHQHHHQRDSIAQYQHDHSCGYCLRHDDCPTAYRWWCQSSFPLSYTSGVSIMAFVINILILIFPWCYLFWFDGICWTQGKHNIWTRLTLCHWLRTEAMILVILELTNWLHNPAGSRTVLDVQYGNITLASYLALWLWLDSL